MRGMFKRATSFNQPLNWIVTKVLDMSSMFSDARSFNQALKWEGIPEDARTWNMFDGTRGGRWENLGSR
jgi:hypothetical protein